MSTENTLNAAVLLLAETIRSIKPVLVPSPVIFDGNSYHSIEDFFYFFERFCSVTYGDDEVSWLQVLPDFLTGEYKCIVDSFGRSKEGVYQTVKQRLLKEFNFGNLRCDYYSRFVKTSRNRGETLLCYFIRLEVLATKIPFVNAVDCGSLVRVNLLNSLRDSVKRNVERQIGYLDDISNEKLVRIAGIIESQLVDPQSDTVKSVSFTDICLPVTIKPKAKRIKCYRCGMLGHIRRNCLVVFHKRKPPGKLPEHSCEGNRGKKYETTSRQKSTKRSNKPFPSGKRVSKSSRMYQGSRFCTSDSGKECPNKPLRSYGAKKYLVPNGDMEYPDIPNLKIPNLNGDHVIEKPVITCLKEGGLLDRSGPLSILCLPGKSNDPSPTPQSTSNVQEKNYCERDMHNNLDWDAGLSDGNVQDSEVINLNDSFASSLNLNCIFQSENDVRDEKESGYSSADSCISGSFSCSENKFDDEMPAFSDGFDCSLLSFGNISYYELELNHNV